MPKKYSKYSGGRMVAFKTKAVNVTGSSECTRAENIEYLFG